MFWGYVGAIVQASTSMGFCTRVAWVWMPSALVGVPCAQPRSKNHGLVALARDYFLAQIDILEPRTAPALKCRSCVDCWMSRINMSKFGMLAMMGDTGYIIFLLYHYYPLGVGSP